jgi:modulator of FtsH protease
MDALTALDAWGDFLAAQVGASAALAGLLFVGVSINLTKILGASSLTLRALLALVVLVVILLLSSLLLFPGQSRLAVGLEILVVGGALWVAGNVVEVRIWRERAEGQTTKTLAVNLLLFEVASISYVVGGVLVLADNPAGMTFVGIAILFSFMKAVIDAWVLLVEINR